MTKVKQLSSSEVLCQTVNNAIFEKKGQDIVNLDMRKLHNSITDFFVICHATNQVQMEAIADEIKRASRENLGEKMISSEGHNDDPDWILLDYFDVVVHIFSEDARKRFNLEDVWADAERIDYDEFGKQKTT